MTTPRASGSPDSLATYQTRSASLAAFLMTRGFYLDQLIPDLTASRRALFLFRASDGLTAAISAFHEGGLPAYEQQKRELLLQARETQRRAAKARKRAGLA